MDIGCQFRIVLTLIELLYKIEALMVSYEQIVKFDCWGVTEIEEIASSNSLIQIWLSGVLNFILSLIIQ